MAGLIHFDSSRTHLLLRNFKISCEWIRVFSFPAHIGPTWNTSPLDQASSSDSDSDSDLMGKLGKLTKLRKLLEKLRRSVDSSDEGEDEDEDDDSDDGVRSHSNCSIINSKFLDIFTLI